MPTAEIGHADLETPPREAGCPGAGTPLGFGQRVPHIRGQGSHWQILGSGLPALKSAGTKGNRVDTSAFFSTGSFRHALTSQSQCPQ